MTDNIQLPSSPSEIVPDGNYPSLELLKDAMKQWSDQARAYGKIKQLEIIAEAMCEPGRPYRGLHDPFVRYRTDDITLHYQKKRWIQIGQVVVSGDFAKIIVTSGGERGRELIGGFQLVNWFDGVPEKSSAAKFIEVYKQERNIYLPGKWEDELFKAYAPALAKIEAAKKAEEIIARDALLERMGVGVPVQMSVEVGR